MLVVTPDILIDDGELAFSFVRAGGPGGQHVNKVATAVQLRFDVQRTAPSRRRKVRIASIAATNLLARSAGTRYSTVMSTGPSAGSGVSTTSGAGQCPEGVRSRPSAPCSGQRQVAASPPASASTATTSALPLPNCWASMPHAKLPTAIPPWNTRMYRLTARARTQAGAAVCAAAFTLDVMAIQAIPPATIPTSTSGTTRR